MRTTLHLSALNFVCNFVAQPPSFVRSFCSSLQSALIPLCLSVLQSALIALSTCLLTPSKNSKKIDCPINVYFVIDTSESIALQTVPIQSLVEHMKQFIPAFINKLETEVYQNQVSITWHFGGLHFSDVVKIYSAFTNSKDVYITRLNGIEYIGRGTFTDCAISNMTNEILTHAIPAVNFAVVVTDGHVTGSPCGGMKMQAEKARDAGIKLFAVAPSQNIFEQGLREIANLPHELYRNNYATTKRGAIEVDEDTIDRIIQVMPQISCPEQRAAAGPDHRHQQQPLQR
uniref:VWFA domain-containing protein n=1 Tax=Chelonoidis abingdonii TaxID=106734 RepID=A0A8C0GTD1_CHEAB